MPLEVICVICEICVRLKYKAKNSFENLVVSQKTLIFAGEIEIKIKNYGKNH